MSTPHLHSRQVPWAILLLALSALGAGGNGDLLRLAGNGRTAFWTATCYPCVVDFDGDGRRDLVGSSRCTGGVVTWFRNIGEDNAPLFSERESFPLKTVDGQPITNPNRGFLLTVAVCDWDGDGRRDLLVGGLCRYLMFYKNIGTNQRAVFARGKPIFDAKAFPGLDYGDDPDTLFQGVFIEPCDWDGDGNLDLICGTYMRERIYFLRNTGRKDADGLPLLAKPVALEAGGKPIDFLLHGKPSVGDWEGDGKLHLMVGQYCVEGSPRDVRGIVGCYYFKNVGDRRHPRLAAGVQLRDADGRLISEGFHSQPTMVDWNRDGRQDLLISGMTGTSLYVNQGTGRQPRLVRQEIPFVGYAPCRVSGFAYPLAYDLDGDGILDLIVADGDGYVWFFKGLAGMQYAPPLKIKSLGKPIHEVGCPDGGEHHMGYVKVAIADWNGDGHPDLVMWTNNVLEGWQSGQLRGWCLKFFPGTADRMDFGAPTEIQAAGQSIRAGYRCKPDVVDLDGDGLRDLVVACGNGTVHDECTLMFFKNLGTAAPAGKGPAGPPRLAAGVPLTMRDGRPLTVDVRTSVRLVDWGRSGKLDLFTGNYWPQGVRYWKNVGTTTRPVFGAPQPLAAVNEIVNSHHEVGVDAVDLDGDGSLDLLVGSGDSGMIHFFRRDFLQKAGAPAGRGTVAAAAEGTVE